jgi:HAD superfamily hydrolase (TIGR01509 family)
VCSSDLDQARAILNERFRRELKPIPGIRTALEKLSGPRCIASSSKPERIRLSLSITGLLDQFEPHIYSATMVERGKPAPDLFLHAARDMGVQPDECLVIEDSPAGVEAANAAGMRVFGFTGGSHALAGGLAAALALLEPDAVFDDMRLLPSLVAASGKGR